MARISKMASRVLATRASLWPDLKTEDLWSRHEHDGFTSIPRTLPIILSVIDDITKGKPASAPYLELWCRAFDEMYVSLGSATALAASCGYNGPRAVRMWSERIESLAELGFIRVASGSSGKLSHAVILHPHKVVKKLHESKQPGLLQPKYDLLVERAREVGADDFNAPKSEPSTGPAKRRR